MTSSTAIVAVMIFVVFTAVMLTAREDVPRADIKLAEMTPVPVPMAIDTNTPSVPQPVEAAKTVVAKPAATAPAPLPVASINHATPVPVNEPVEPEREKTSSVTISGCLENDEGTFLLTDASGTAAPKSRSWKSGFIRKRPAPIELADGVGTLGLRSHVGRRVSATGTLVDREMRVDSLRALGACE